MARRNFSLQGRLAAGVMSAEYRRGAFLRNLLLGCGGESGSSAGVTSILTEDGNPILTENSEPLLTES